MKNFKSIKGKGMTMLMIAIAIAGLICVLWNAPEKVTIVDASFHVTIDGKVVSFNEEMGKPYLIKETQRTIVPLRVIAENMGYDVSWDQKLRKATVIGNGTTVELIIGKNTALVNGKIIPIDTKDGKPTNTQSMLLPAKGSLRTYVPLRFISEVTGADVKYHRKNGVNYIVINTGGEVVRPEPQPEEPQPEEPKPDDTGIIEPKFKVYPRDGATHFEIYLENFMDYKGTDATFSPELISHPHYHRYTGIDIFIPDKYTEVSELEVLANKKPNYNQPLFMVYRFSRDEYYLDIETMKPQALPKKGEIMTVEFTVKMNGKSKAFTLDVPFPK